MRLDVGGQVETTRFPVQRHRLTEQGVRGLVCWGLLEPLIGWHLKAS